LSLNISSAFLIGRKAVMQPFPHTYRVIAEGAANGTIYIKSHGVPDLIAAAP
jgi:hypothetical protein